MTDNTIEDLAVVSEVHEDFILVQMMKSGACHSCGMSGFCHGKDRTVTHKIFTTVKYNVGDLLRIEISAGLRVATSFLIYVVPILAMILFYSFSSYLFHFSEPVSILLSFAGLVLSGILIHRIDKKMGSKIKFEIIEKVDK